MSAKPGELRELREWLRARGFALKQVRTGGDQVCFEQRCVTVRKRANGAATLAVALHECGHVLVHLQRKQNKRKCVAGTTWKQSRLSSAQDESGRVKRRALQTCEEEFAAWERGKRLAGRLRLKLDRRAFERQKTRCLMSYVRWVALPPAPALRRARTSPGR